MHLSRCASFIRIPLSSLTASGMLLLELFAAMSASAQTAHGSLSVSMTVLPSCEVRTGNVASSGGGREAGQWPADAVMVSCPPAYPFRARLAHATEVGYADSDADAGMAFTGASMVDLLGLSAGTGNAGVNNTGNRRARLTISY